MPLVSYLQLYPTWMEVTSLSTTADAASTDYVLGVLSVVLALAGESEEEVLLRPNLAADAEAELARGARVLVGVRENLHSQQYIGPTVSLRPDEDAVFIGLCGEVATAELRAYVEFLQGNGISTTPAQTIVDLVTKPEEMAKLERWTRGTEPLPWGEQDPATRLLDPQETPEVILAGMTLVMVRIEIPDSWRTLPATICTKAPLGWNRCSSLELDEIGIEIDSYTSSGEALEIWLLDLGANTSEPLARLGTVPASVLDSIDKESPSVHVTLTGDFTDLPSLLEGVAADGVDVATSEG
jgi:hypothetical protein